MTTRREAIAWMGAAAAATRCKSAFAGNAFPASRYAGAMVIDALGGPGVDDPSATEDAPLSAKALADAKASGVTAVNVTVNQVGNGPDRFEKTIDNIASVEYEIAAHPDRFLKVLRASDLTQAKSSGRMGLIFGFQDTSMLDGDLKRLEVFQNLGLRICQPTYNVRNLMGDGCLLSRRMRVCDNLRRGNSLAESSDKPAASPARSESRRPPNDIRGHRGG